MENSYNAKMLPVYDENDVMLDTAVNQAIPKLARSRDVVGKSHGLGSPPFIARKADGRQNHE